MSGRGLVKAMTRTGEYREDWETPSRIFDPLNEEFRFGLDVCATPENSKCWHHFTKEDDALSREWRVQHFAEYRPWWMNPPYGRDVIPLWVEKAHQEAQAGRWGVALLPCYTGNGWWLDIVMQYEVRFVRKKIHFVGAKHNAAFWNAVVVFRGSGERQP